MSKVSLPKDKIRILLLEGVHQSAVETLNSNGYTNVEYLKTSLSEEDLIEKVKDVHFIGIRSRTQITEAVVQAAEKLVAVGCFCIGTNQVDLKATQFKGIPVFNAPFSNTRSVAELVLGQLILLLRGVPSKNAKAHRGEWEKSAVGSYEARGKTLGIIGYGHIGTQLSILAEHLGMRVQFYDIEDKLVLGNSVQVKSLDTLLATSDVVSLHVPETLSTKDMIGKAELSKMKKGAILINASRGTVVDIDALVEAMESEHLAGAAIDVFPVEPKSNTEEFESPLRQFDNVILTPHVGGSTQEAQENIGIEVAGKLAKYSDNGSTLSAVNFPEVSLPDHPGRSRLLHIHENRPGVLNQINQTFAEKGINIEAQYLQTVADIGYVVVDVEANKADEGLAQLQNIKGTIKTRLLH
ncbi:MULTISPECIES: phosphoglycerate dehydrogenase [unclassified Alteromonas]|uniref:phosphoglycerate dehydrogenase n=1 Tax=unclassified Alteromonas TaxID=2614992 RepID=UPI000C686E96|nr:phosphoglycerate dehydrogenase [Alteromonas sp. RKMC-009]AYA65285.1 phosphoglycerate dehydrogenase [Alteromonas sp. RKMC-009]MBT82176.1 phosphoglycerate dehydrogenase [Alteromonadaceae bacterium]MEC7691471.1 phosphoglycerate dehydrogenase [Pseudomonadota bacterium]